VSTHSEEQKGEEAEAAEAQSERAAAGMATLSVGEDDDEFHDAQTETPPTSPTPRPGGGGTLQIGAKEFTPMALKPATEFTPAAAEVCGHPPQRDARGVWQPAHEHPPPFACDRHVPHPADARPRALGGAILRERCSKYGVSDRRGPWHRTYAPSAARRT
jgi:hypothetical protein